MFANHISCLLFLTVMALAWSAPLSFDRDRGSLAAVSDLNSRLASHAGLLQSERDPRLPLPSTQDLETIKKVAQILITLGEQVLPSILGERPSSPPVSVCESPPQEIPNDAVKD